MNEEDKLNFEFAVQVFEREMKRKPLMSDEKDMATVAILSIGIRYGRSGLLLTRNELNHLHDTLYNVTDNSYTDMELAKIWEIVPNNIKAEAVRWGLYDTVVRDKVYVWAKNNTDLILQTGL